MVGRALKNVAPCIRITFKIYDNDAKIHSGWTEYYLGDVEAKGLGVKNIEWKYQDGPFRQMLLTWDTDSGIGQGLTLCFSVKRKVAEMMAALQSTLTATKVEVMLEIGDTEDEETFNTFLQPLPQTIGLNAFANHDQQQTDNKDHVRSQAYSHSIQG